MVVFRKESPVILCLYFLAATRLFLTSVNNARRRMPCPVGSAGTTTLRSGQPVSLLVSGAKLGHRGPGQATVLGGPDCVLKEIVSALFLCPS